MNVKIILKFRFFLDAAAVHKIYCNNIIIVGIMALHRKTDYCDRMYIEEESLSIRTAASL